MKSLLLKFACALVAVSLAVGPGTSPVAAQVSATGNSEPGSADGGKQVPLCAADNIDATFAYHDLPAGEQTVTLYFLNKGTTPCRLKGPPNPSFAVDGHSMRVGSCPFCGRDNKTVPYWDRDNKPVAWWNRPENQALLGPGMTVAIDMNWASIGDSCQWADWAGVFFDWTESNDFRAFANFLFIPSDWPIHICSPVRSFGYKPVAEAPFIGGNKAPAIRVTVLQNSVYSDERATLHVELVRPAQSSEKPVGCASLYTVRREGSLQTRLEPLRTVGSSRVDSYTPEQIKEDKERKWPQWKNDFRRECHVSGGGTTADAEIAANVLATVTHVEWRTAPSTGTAPAFLSVATKFNVLDVDSLPANWGEPARGIRAGLSVDKETFTVGERVPLHVRWENIDASAALGQGECNEPEPDIEIRDAQHHVLKTIPSYPDCMGHGWGPFEIPKAKQQRAFREFQTTPDPLPHSAWPVSTLGPGVYYLVAVWSPRILEREDGSGQPRIGVGNGKIGAVYGTARSRPVRIEIVPSNR